jgi:hypothetical protein
MSAMAGLQLLWEKCRVCRCRLSGCVAHDGEPCTAPRDRQAFSAGVAEMKRHTTCGKCAVSGCSQYALQWAREHATLLGRHSTTTWLDGCLMVGRSMCWNRMIWFKNVVFRVLRRYTTLGAGSLHLAGVESWKQGLHQPVKRELTCSGNVYYIATV